jgi:hypothetical protein
MCQSQKIVHINGEVIFLNINERCRRRGYRPRVISPQEKNSSNYVVIYCNLLHANKSIDEYQAGREIWTLIC